MTDTEDRSGFDRVDMSVRELMTEMKDTSEVIVDLAYACLMYNSQSMAEKVRELENEMDDLKFAVRYRVLLATRTRDDAKQMVGLLEVASAADKISDAASDVVDLLRFPADKRPFISKILREADERIRMLRISPDSDMIGNTIEKLGVEAQTGCKIIAIKNRHGWTYDPEDGIKIRSGDDIIVRGTDEGADLLQEYAYGKKPYDFPKVSGEEDAEQEAEEDIWEEEQLTEELRGEDGGEQ